MVPVEEPATVSRVPVLLELRAVRFPEKPEPGTHSRSETDEASELMEPLVPLAKVPWASRTTRLPLLKMAADAREAAAPDAATTTTRREMRRMGLSLLRYPAARRKRRERGRAMCCKTFTA